MNPLFQSFQQNQAAGPTQFLQQSLQNIASQVQQMGMTPEQACRQLIQNGQMSQQQFEQYRQIANQITGKNL